MYGVLKAALTDLHSFRPTYYHVLEMISLILPSDDCICKFASL